VLQPDVTAPGADILAAYSPIVSPSNSPHDKMRVKYSILSGTSMACPHASGAAAYVKTFHPNWSPSAIKSALLTTGNLSKFLLSCNASKGRLPRSVSPLSFMFLFFWMNE
jgi:subtilisin family serine protease